MNSTPGSNLHRRMLGRMGGAVVTQGLLSLASFAAGWLLLRSAGPTDYAHWVLCLGVVSLAVSLQSAFLGPPLSLRLAQADGTARSVLAGALLGEQRRLACGIGAMGACGVLAVWLCLPGAWATLAGVTLLALLAQLHREFLRQLLFATNRVGTIFFADLAFAAALVTGVAVARQLPPSWRVAAAVLSILVAAIVSYSLLSMQLRRELDPVVHRRPGFLREIAPLALWSVSGAALAWASSQGFLYLVAARLGPAAVGALAASRLPMMPMNLLSSGLGGILAPSAARWLPRIGSMHLRRRLLGLGLLLATTAIAWIALLWPWRHGIFAALSKAPIPEGSTLLLGWGLAYTVMALRDTLAYLPAASGNYRALTLLTGGVAVVSSLGCLAGMQWLPDARGALLGVLAGESFAMLGIGWMTLRTGPHHQPLIRDETTSPA